jgi:hypothetical protein
MVAVSTLASAPLLWTALTPSLFTSPETACLAAHYYGHFGGRALFQPSPACFDQATGSLAAGHIAEIENRADGQLVWVEEEAVEDVVRGADASFAAELDGLIDGLQAPLGAQVPLGASPASGHVDVLVREEKMALLQLPRAASEQLLLAPPRLWKVSFVEPAPRAFVPVPKAAAERVRALVHALAYDPVVGALVGGLNVPQMRKDIAHLTGEAPGSNITSRHSFATGARDAAAWLKGEFEALGATCELKPVGAPACALA